MTEWLAVIALPCADRARGFPWKQSGLSLIFKMVYGYMVALVFGHAADTAAVAITIGMMIGMSWGWGNAIGPAIIRSRPNPDQLEWWQFKQFAQVSAYWSLTYRGAIWGASVAAVAGWFEPHTAWLIPIYALAMPAAVWLALRMAYVGDKAWAAQEYLRGAIVALLLLVQVS